jgi:hypothetical protein
MLTLADAVALGLATAVATTVVLAGEGTVEGAVYSPELDIVPGPLTVHFTEVFVLPVTVAENCTWPPVCACADFGEIATETAEAA